MKKITALFVIAYFVSSVYAQTKIYKADASQIIYSGRIDRSSADGITLIGSASFASFKFKGDSCSIFLKNGAPDGLQNYIALEMDSKYLGRLRIESHSMEVYPVPVEQSSAQHILTVYKATEAQNGNIVFGGVVCHSLLNAPVLPEQSIEFIGNSITCGMGVDHKEIPCHEDQWYDQHNAFLAYGPRVARKLNVRYMLSSVSGIGIYRNWNSAGPTMPQVYENLYLNTDSSRTWDFAQFTPDIVSICLGTNDFSDGDGKKERLPFNAEAFTKHYIDFVQTVFNHYPHTKIVLLNSPMVTGEKNKIFIVCLKKVITHFSKTDYKSIELFQFTDIMPHGCDTHPDAEDHRLMAEQLYPFYKGLLDNL